MKPHRNILSAALCAALACAGLTVAIPAVASGMTGALPQVVPTDPRPTGLPATLAELGLEETVAAAVAWHPRVRDAAGRVFEADEYIDVAHAGYFPQVSAGVTSERGNRNVTGYNSRQVHRFTVSVSQMLYDFGKVGSAVDRARAVREAAQARVLLAVDDLARDVAQAWIELRRYEGLQAIAREQKQGVTGIADRVRQRHQQGASPRSDAMQAQAREEAARAFELETEAQLERWRSQLRHLTGLAAIPATSGELPGSMQRACVSNAGATEPPSVLVARADARAAEADMANARAQTRPTLSLDGTVGRALDAESRLGESHDATIMLNVTAPLYQGGGNQARRRAAGYALGSAQAAVDHARLVASQLLEDARAQAAGNAQRSEVLAERIASLEQTRTLYGQQYLDLGTRSLLDLLNAEQEYQQARIERANNAHDLARLQVDCLHGTGRLRDALALHGVDAGGVVLAP